jgi:hypothetical protein
VVWLCVLLVGLAFAFFGRDALRSRLQRAPARARARPPEIESAPGMSAAWLLAECGRLGGTGASWTELATALNPDADSQIEALLGRLRAAHSGVPLAILKAIEDGCRTALAENAEASGFDALSVATRNSRWTSSARW